MRTGMTLIEVMIVILILSIVFPGLIWFLTSTMGDYGKVQRYSEAVVEGLSSIELFFTKIYSKLKEFSGSSFADIEVKTYEVSGRVTIHSGVEPTVFDAKIEVVWTPDGTRVAWYMRREGDSDWGEPEYLTPPFKDIDVKFYFSEDSTLVSYLGPGIVVNVVKEYGKRKATRKYFVPLVNIGIISR